MDVAPSRLTFAEGFILTKPNMDWYEEQFFGPDGDRSDPRGSPLLADDLSGVAPALVVTAGASPRESTANLMAPIVMYEPTRRAVQLVLSGSGLPVRAPLLSA